MSKRRPKIDPNQGSFDFTMKIDEYVATKQAILDSISESEKPSGYECEHEANVVIAAAIKQAQRAAGISREQLCDGVNEFFGRTAERVKAGECRKPLSLDMLNSYLSKPRDNPIHAYLLFAIHHVCNSLEPARVLVSAEGAQIATREEVRLLALGRLDQTMADMQALKKQLKEA